MLKVINVGQGDSLILQPSSGCIWTDIPLVIDTGPTAAKVFEKIAAPRINILITHSHSDHIGGLPALIKNKEIEKIYIPYFLPEISSIFKFLKGKTKIKTKPINWKSIEKLNFELIGDGDYLCKHAKALNPPKHPADFSSLSAASDTNTSIAEALAILSNLGIELPREEIENYTSPITPKDNRIDAEYQNVARQFVHKFFIALSQSLDGATVENISYYLTRNLELTSNEASIVFRHKHENDHWLFTGDADLNAFERIIGSHGDISSKFLKIPHHGSRENLSKKIIDAIKPSHAIISHNNGIFGRSKDPHPHQETIDLLDREEVTSYYTNHVLKNNVQIKKATTGSVLSGLIEFI